MTWTREVRGRVRSRTLWRSAFTLLLTMTLGGCALFFSRPSVTIADVRVLSVGLVGATAEVMLDVENPNGFDLRLTDIRYRLLFADETVEDGWRVLTDGASDERIVVPANGTQQVRLALPFRYSDLGLALGSILTERTLGYRLQGDVRFEAPIRDVRVPFDRRGVFAP